MTVYTDLLKLYNNVESTLVGKHSYLKFANNKKLNTLVPVFHQYVNAGVMINLDAKGELISVTPSTEYRIVSPTNLQASTRTGTTIAPQPLHDTSKYLFGTGAGFSAYIEQLKKWLDATDNPFIKAVYTYISKGTLQDDLTEEVSKIEEKKPTYVFTIGGEYPWENVDFINQYISYYWEVLQDKIDSMTDEEQASNSITHKDIFMGTDYLTGEQAICMAKSPKMKLTIDSGAKLMTANDKTGFSYRGLFPGPSFSSIGIDSAFKVTSMVKYLEDNQKIGNGDNGEELLIWDDSPKQEVPSWLKVIANSDKSDTGLAMFTKVKGLLSQPLDKDISETVKLVHLRANNPGQLGFGSYQGISFRQYKENLLRWANLNGGTGLNVYSVGRTIYSDSHKSASNKKLRSQAIDDITECIFAGKQVPLKYMLKIETELANPIGYHQGENSEASDEWNKSVIIYAELRKYNGVKKMDKRSYLFGKLLFNLDKIERDAVYNKQKKSGNSKEPAKHATLASKFTNMYMRTPAQAYSIIKPRLTTGYINGSDYEYLSESKLNDIIAEIGEDWSDESLSPDMYLGYAEAFKADKESRKLSKKAVDM